MSQIQEKYLMAPKVVAVHLSPAYTMSKPSADSITLVTGLGVEGDAHNGATVKHRSRVAKDPMQPNLRQVHLIHSELFDELRSKGFGVYPGMIGENITTVGIDLLSLPTGTMLKIGRQVTVKITGLRNPCAQLDGLIPGLMKAVLGLESNGEVIRKTGVMSVVVSGGEVRPSDRITVELPKSEHLPLQAV